MTKIVKEKKEDDFIKIHETQWKKTKIRNRILTLLLIIFAIFSFYIFINGFTLESLLNGNGDLIEKSIYNSSEVQSDAGTITEIFSIFVYWNEGWFIKIMVFLGIVYLIQIIFTVTFDIVELLIILGLLVSKSFKGIYKLFIR